MCPGFIFSQSSFVFHSPLSPSNGALFPQALSVCDPSGETVRTLLKDFYDARRAQVCFEKPTCNCCANAETRNALTVSGNNLKESMTEFTQTLVAGSLFVLPKK